MPQIPEPKGASPDLMPFLRWVRGVLIDMIDDQRRQQSSASNTNASQNSTMSTLVDRLGTVESMMETIASGIEIDASQVVSGIFNGARIPDLDASKITSGTLTRPVSAPGGVSATGDVYANGHGTFNQAWNYNVSGVTRLAVWMDSSGKLGQTSSTERYKKDITPWAPNEAATRLLKLVQFRWDPYYGGKDDHIEVGLIAEQLHNLGLRWLVAYEADGKTPMGVQYERLALLLLPLTQRLADEVDSLRAELDATHARLEAIEARLAAVEAN